MTAIAVTSIICVTLIILVAMSNKKNKQRRLHNEA